MCQTVGAHPIDKVMKEVEKEEAKRKIAFGLKHENVPKATESSAVFSSLPFGSSALVFRTTNRGLEGPAEFVKVDGRTFVVQLDKVWKTFKSIQVRQVVRLRGEGVTVQNSHRRVAS